MLRLISLSRKSVVYLNSNCSVEGQLVLFAGSTPGILSRHTLEEASARTENQMREMFGRNENTNKLVVLSLAATNTSLLVFHAYVRAARARRMSGGGTRSPTTRLSRNGG